MKLKFLIIFFGLIIASCYKSTSSTEQGDEKQRLANQVRRKVAIRLKDEAKLCPCGTIGQMLREIQVLGLSFYYYQPVDIIGGRKLLIKSIEAVICEVNNETQIHPFLAQNPFTPNNVEIRIYLWNHDGTTVSSGSLCTLVAEEGKLNYKIKNPENNFDLITVHQETYEEALQRLADPTLPLVPYQPDSRKITSQDLTKLRKSVSFVDNDGSIWHLDENGCWAK